MKYEHRTQLEAIAEDDDEENYIIEQPTTQVDVMDYVKEKRTIKNPKGKADHKSKAKKEFNLDEVNEYNRRSAVTNSIKGSDANPDPPAAVGTRRLRASGGSATAGNRSTRRDDPSASGGPATARLRDIEEKRGSLCKAFMASGGPAAACCGCPCRQDDTSTDGDRNMDRAYTDCDYKKAEQTKSRISPLR